MCAHPPEFGSLLSGQVPPHVVVMEGWSHEGIIGLPGYFVDTIPLFCFGLSVHMYL